MCFGCSDGSSLVLVPWSINNVMKSWTDDERYIAVLIGSVMILSAVGSDGGKCLEDPPVGTRNPLVLGSSEPTPKEEASSLLDPNCGVQGEPVQKILRSTLLHSVVSYATNAVSPTSPASPWGPR